MAIPFLVFLVMSCILVLYLFLSISTSFAQNSDMLTPEMLGMLADARMKLFNISVIGISLMGVMCGLLWLVVSHRVFGPMVQIHRQVDSILNGDFEFQIRLRKFDEFKPLADKLNKLAKTLGESQSL